MHLDPRALLLALLAAVSALPGAVADHAGIPTQYPCTPEGQCYECHYAGQDCRPIEEEPCPNADCECQRDPSQQGCLCDEQGCRYDTCTDHPEDPACNPCPSCDPGCQTDCGDICIPGGPCIEIDDAGGCIIDRIIAANAAPVTLPTLRINVDNVRAVLAKVEYNC